LRDFLSDDHVNKNLNEIGSAFEDIGFSTQRSFLNDQLVDELYGEKFFRFTFRNKTQL
jgi:hypothetical protein